MAEMWDVLDENGNKTGRLHERSPMMGAIMNPGDYHLVVHVWIMNSKNEFLISKRAAGIWNSGMWQTTSGCAIVGDDSLSAALREVKEELGIVLSPKDGQMFRQHSKEGLLFDEWLFYQEVDILKIALQPSETCDAMWASGDEIEMMLSEGNFMSGKPPCNPIPPGGRPC